MTKISTLLALLGVLVCTPQALADPPDKDWKVTAGVDVLTGYIVQNKPVVVTDKPVYQLNLNAVHKSGFYADVWVSTEVNKKPFGNHRDSKIELTGGYRTTFEGFDVRTSVALFMVPEMDNLTGDTVQIDAEVSKTLKLSDQHSLRPYVLIEMNPVIRGPDFGTFYQIGLTDTWKQNDWSVSNQVAYIHNDGWDNNIAIYNGRISYTGIQNVTLSPVVIKGFHEFGDSRTKFVFGVGASTAF